MSRFLLLPPAPDHCFSFYVARTTYYVVPAHGLRHTHDVLRREPRRRHDPGSFRGIHDHRVRWRKKWSQRRRRRCVARSGMLFMLYLQSLFTREMLSNQ